MQIRKSLFAASIISVLALGAAQNVQADLAYAYSLLTVSDLKVFVVANVNELGVDGNSINNFFPVGGIGNSFEAHTSARLTGDFNGSDGHFDDGASADPAPACVTTGIVACPGNNTFTPLIPGGDVSSGSFAVSDIDLQRVGLDGIGVSFTASSEAQATGNSDLPRILAVRIYAGISTYSSLLVKNLGLEHFTFNTKHWSPHWQPLPVMALTVRHLVRPSRLQSQIWMPEEPRRSLGRKLERRLVTSRSQLRRVILRPVANLRPFVKPPRGLQFLEPFATLLQLRLTSGRVISLRQA